MSTFLGCDPGAKGAICILDPEDKYAVFFPTPGGNTSPGVLFTTLHAWLMAHQPPYKAAIEDVHSIYGMSAKSNFNFGANAGAALTLLECLLPGQKIHRVQPKRWQKEVGITAKGKAIKKAVASLAHELYPEAELYGPRGGLMDGRADALMIAHYLSLQE